MSDEGEYDLVLTAPARRALTDRLPETVAAAVIDFLASVLISSISPGGWANRFATSSRASGPPAAGRIGSCTASVRSRARSSFCASNIDGTLTGAEPLVDASCHAWQDSGPWRGRQELPNGLCWKVGQLRAFARPRTPTTGGVQAPPSRHSQTCSRCCAWGSALRTWRFLDHRLDCSAPPAPCWLCRRSAYSERLPRQRRS